jgi:hypothetical protein
MKKENTVDEITKAMPYDALLGNVLSTKEIAKQIANKANMPYCWEDIQDRLINRLPMPFKLSD